MDETSVTRPFADGEYRFWLGLRQIVAFEREHGALLEFYGTLASATGVNGDGQFVYAGPGGPGVSPMLALVRHALIGGNSGLVDAEESAVGPTRAATLVTDYCYPARPISELAALSFQIAHAAVSGVKLSKKKRKPRARKPSPLKKDD